MHKLVEKIKTIETASPDANADFGMEKEFSGFRENIEEYIEDRIKEETRIKLDQIISKINNIEMRLQSPEPAPAAKKPKSRVVEGQVVLFDETELNGEDVKETASVSEESVARESAADDMTQTSEGPAAEESAAPATDNEEKRPRDNEKEVINKEHSRLVRTVRNEEIPVTDFSSLPSEQKESSPAAENAEEKSAAPYKNISLRNLANDPFSNYQVEVVERILHDSRTQEAREDKVRVMELWKTLHNNATHEQLDIADLLQEGQIVAVGNKEFILVYPNASLCNQVMKIKFKREALNLLYKNLGDTYNYIALPEKVWSEKRNEYINQYNIGVRFPKLTPIDDPSLDVKKENQDFLERQEKLIDQAIKIFGEDFVKIR